MKLTADDLFLANDLDYLKKYPEVKREIIRFVKDMPPEECLCCVFFKWIRDEENRISGRMCCAKQEIQEEDFAEGQRAKGCPVDEQEAGACISALGPAAGEGTTSGWRRMKRRSGSCTGRP